jgi:hypothetical protein
MLPAGQSIAGAAGHSLAVQARWLLTPSLPLAAQAQLSDDVLEHFTLGVLARVEGIEPQATNVQDPTALSV